MVVVQSEKKYNRMIYHVDINKTDSEMDALKNTFVNKSDISLILDHDADVYTKDGTLLLVFRKKKLSEKKISDFYDNVIDFALNVTSNRGNASDSSKMNVRQNKKIMTNIIGYFDKLSPMQKYIIKQQNKKISLYVRPTRFLMDDPEKFKKLIPLVKEIDQYYKTYIPDKYSKQHKKAKETPFKIADTSFTTITTNVNFQTTIHKDTGDDEEGFGNLVVIENGNYTGGETCFPQYGIGVDVRTGDVLFMNVHEWHGNLPMEPENEEVQRLSIVCYLRKAIWEKTKNKTRKFMMRHNQTIRNLRKT